ncbi:TPA: hypothetical protein QH074_004307 [Enterobacter hormaechei subsp. steigerwaltii]|nr:hypothetical protein [Enterobacter hormaechei subsp. steigerwaltii]
MKKVILAAVIAAATMTSINANAISHEYRHRLAASGCTQVDEANGVCDTGASAQKQRYNDSSECTQVQEANGECEMTSRHNGGSYNAPEGVIGKYQGEAVDAMKDQGWSQTNEEGTHWRKGRHTATLKMSNSGQVSDVVIH